MINESLNEEKGQEMPTVQANTESTSALCKDAYGFTKDVLDILNGYVAVADAKASIIVAGALAGIAFLVSTTGKSDNVHLFAGISILLLAGATAACAHALIPRTPSGGDGLIFWIDIRNRTSQEQYWNDLCQLNAESRERQFATQSWHVSAVLKRKYESLKWAIVLFFLAVIPALIAGWLNRGG